ncbi:hypothetical protein [Novilysobacter selenitireducens]|uniref:Secreted protein n=1 Tax=Novilysobacter selenitireducens TaxID=2872639 RepID=A0ABS7T9S2_9GAMM|nr:hypothetical protein [Lysobacter selenitireducens]MBZ4040610.1 hypothetical protein [Lysobacter selenitireducens]
MRQSALLIALTTALVALPSLAADPVPEIERGEAAPQAVGAAHTLRTIPEACARLEGAFTGQADAPYRFAVVRSSPNCQPRARFVDAAEAKPSTGAGWVLNDLIRVPNASCQTQQAVVRVWRKPLAQAQATERDGQGQMRVYLEEMRKEAEAGKLDAVPLFAASMSVEGLPCGG